MKYKKLLAIIIFMIVIVITYVFFHSHTEAPKPNGVPIIVEDKDFTIKDSITKVEQKNTIANNNVTKYKILDRDLVSPIDSTNKKKVVLLTIDDGPSKRTKEMLAILNKHNAKAIFFINGVNEKNNVGVIEETNKEGFAVGNHTWSHLNLKREKNDKTIKKEIDTNTELITKLTGTSPRFFRAPYGESNAAIRDLVKNDGMIFMDWSGAAKDWEKATVEKDVFIKNAVLNLHSGSILLIHEHPWSVANLDGLLTDIEGRGYSFVDPKDIIE